VSLCILPARGDPQLQLAAFKPEWADTHSGPLGEEMICSKSLIWHSVNAVTWGAY
jgi:hypothetical protein